MIKITKKIKRSVKWDELGSVSFRVEIPAILFCECLGKAMCARKHGDIMNAYDVAEKQMRYALISMKMQADEKAARNAAYAAYLSARADGESVEDAAKAAFAAADEKAKKCLQSTNTEKHQ